jgi:hypothetical protein
MKALTSLRTQDKVQNKKMKKNMPNISRRGFASMDPKRQKRIASMGGRAAHAKGTAHEFTSEEARIAGRKGGKASHAGRR